MASLLQKTLPKRSQIIGKIIDATFGCSEPIRCRSYIFKRPKPLPDWNREAAALAHKGYLRSQDSYTPPSNVAQIVQSLKDSSAIQTGAKGSKFSLEDKLKLLPLCEKEFGRAVPNSTLHEMNTIDAVVEFYETPVNNFLPLDELTTRKLPPNLYIRKDYVRFNTDTSAIFNGNTAFPRSSTIVTGLKYRKRYDGYESKPKWH